MFCVTVGEERVWQGDDLEVAEQTFSRLFPHPEETITLHGPDRVLKFAFRRGLSWDFGKERDE